MANHACDTVWVMSHMGDHIKRLRLNRGDSQEAVARRADISTGTYIRVERGYNEPSLETLRRIAAALEVGIEELVAGPGRAAS